MFRRSIVAPLLVFAAITALIDPGADVLRHGAAVVAVVVGPVLLITIGVLAVYRRPDLIPYMPAYLFLRLFRAYTALEMLFTLPLKDAAATSTADDTLWPLVATNRLWNIGVADATAVQMSSTTSLT